MGGAVRMKNDAIMMIFFLLLCTRKIKEFKTLRFNRCKKGVCVFEGGVRSLEKVERHFHCPTVTCVSSSFWKRMKWTMDKAS